MKYNIAIKATEKIMKEIIETVTASSEGGASMGGNIALYIVLGVIVLGVIALMIYSFVTRKKQAKFAETQRESLVAGDVIETVGGIIGKIVTVNNNSGEREFIIETGEEGRRTTLTVDAKALYRVISQQNPPPDPKAAKKNKSEQA